ncbi:MAG: hypothetical protein ACLS43_07400 [Evtepia gabavorous]
MLLRPPWNEQPSGLPRSGPVIQFIGGGRDANAPVCLSLQGSAFSAPPLMAIFEAQVQAYLRDTLGLHVTLWQGDNALPVGTAAAALYRT